MCSDEVECSPCRRRFPSIAAFDAHLVTHPDSAFALDCEEFDGDELISDEVPPVLVPVAPPVSSVRASASARQRGTQGRRRPVLPPAGQAVRVLPDGAGRVRCS